MLCIVPTQVDHLRSLLPLFYFSALDVLRAWEGSVRFLATFDGQFLSMLIGTFSALFLLRFYTNFSAKQCKIPLKFMFLRLRCGQKVAVADDFWSFSDYDLKQLDYFF